MSEEGVRGKRNVRDRMPEVLRTVETGIFYLSGLTGKVEWVSGGEGRLVVTNRDDTHLKKRRGVTRRAPFKGQTDEKLNFDG